MNTFISEFQSSGGMAAKHRWNTLDPADTGGRKRETKADGTGGCLEKRRIPSTRQSFTGGNPLSLVALLSLKDRCGFLGQISNLTPG